MTENKRFELTIRGNEIAQYEIIDHNQENLTVYNDLGCVYFSSATKVCELLNNLENENKQLKQVYSDAKSDVERYEQILKDIMEGNLLVQDMKKELLE